MEIGQLNDSTGRVYAYNITRSTLVSTPITYSISPVDPALAGCYHAPYGGWGTGVHAIFAWNIIWLCCGRRPLAPWTQISNSVVRLLPCCASILGLIVTAIFSSILKECEDSLV